MFFDKDYEGRRDEKFVSDGIKKFTEYRNLVSASREHTVSDVAKGRDQKDRDCQCITVDTKNRFAGRRQKYDHQQRNNNNSTERDVIRQVHRVRPL
jgi:hypothetical protein